ncbi:hypothetical protein [Colwellia psychrerythraea]|uniref:Uncharacterized protein n=1 Tax=Colwellia psychrerythraea (strain 34H / ATCC BAA-681) TaxID=167879 RepID=Q487S2_COLP3|nr:hypothetical protein [Colwellia psychrerythraea]AAZ26970.1 hypothetical protein CPS_0944 [Colwellia psychrerythraea 34H]
MLNTLRQHSNFTPANAFMTDSRQQDHDKDAMWDKLNLSQQYAVCTLGQFGYLLTYVRSIGDARLAILKQDGKIATINEAGIINVNPAIKCRQ